MAIRPRGERGFGPERRTSVVGTSFDSRDAEIAVTGADSSTTFAALQPERRGSESPSRRRSAVPSSATASSGGFVRCFATIPRSLSVPSTWS